MSKLSQILLLSEGIDGVAEPFSPAEFERVRRELAQAGFPIGQAGSLADLPQGSLGGETAVHSNFTKVTGGDGKSGGPKIPADLFIAGHCGSTFDIAWKLVAQGMLEEWGAALALAQTTGRGQLRREWLSPVGNMYVSFRLPASGHLGGQAATVLLGLLFCEAFAKLGLSLQLKWPNDLVLEAQGKYGKLGGILLEEKNGCLVAGIGVNIDDIPGAEALRDGASLPAARLPAGFTLRGPIRLWLALVKSIIMIYSGAFMANSHNQLLRKAEEKLLWRGEEVLVTGEGEAPFYGIITGLSANGGLELLTGGIGSPVCREINSGSVLGPIGK